MSRETDHANIFLMAAKTRFAVTGEPPVTIRSRRSFTSRRVISSTVRSPHWLRTSPPLSVRINFLSSSGSGFSPIRRAVFKSAASVRPGVLFDEQPRDSFDGVWVEKIGIFQRP